MARIAVNNFGGLNQGRAPSDLDPNDFTNLVNWYTHGGKLYRRGGMRRLTTLPWSQRVTGLVSFQPSDDTISRGLGLAGMVVGGPTNLGVMVGNAITTIPNGPTASRTSFLTSQRRWGLFQFKDVCYGLRVSAGLVRTDGITAVEAGIVAPATAPTIADGAAGAIPAANFQAVYTFYNSNTGLESDPSPASNILAHGGATVIAWTGITISTNPQVTSRRLYRTLPNQTGEYFLVAELADNVSTTYPLDNVLAQSLGDAASFTNGVPPNGLRMGAVWKDRLFASDGVDLYHSQDGLIEAFDPDAFIPIAPDDRHEIRAIHAWGDRLVVAKTNGLYYLVGSDPSTYALPPVPNIIGHGCVSHHSMQSAGGYLFWLNNDGVYRTDGNTVLNIADVKLRDVIADMDEEAARDAVAAVFPERNWYVLSIPGYAQFIYNYVADAWWEATTREDIQAIGMSINTDYAQEMWVADEVGHVYRFHDTAYGYDDNRDPFDRANSIITSTFDTKAFAGPTAGKHVVEHAALQCPQYSEMITLAIISEGTALKTRTVSLDYDPRWKLYSLSTRHQATAQSQLRVTYTGRTRIELEAFALDISPIDRPSMLAR